MPLILCIETATSSCSVALTNGSDVVALAETDEKNAHSTVLNLLIRDAMQQAAVLFSQLDSVAVSMGPGSYTGLRIGVSTAKAICFAIDKPLIAIGTLHAMAWGFRNSFPNLPPNAFFCPMIDARRMEVYCAVFDQQLKTVKPVSAEIINPHSFDDLLKDYQVFFFGDGAAKSKIELEHQPGARFESYSNSASHMTALAFEQFKSGKFEDLAYFEPFYLKNFVAGKPRVKGLYN